MTQKSGVNGLDSENQELSGSKSQKGHLFFADLEDPGLNSKAAHMCQPFCFDAVLLSPPLGQARKRAMKLASEAEVPPSCADRRTASDGLLTGRWGGDHAGGGGGGGVSHS